MLLWDQFPHRRMKQEAISKPPFGAHNQLILKGSQGVLKQLEVNREGLLNHPFDTGVASAVGQLLARLGGDEDKMSVGVSLANLLDDRETIRPRQDRQVRYDDIKGSGSAQLQSFSAGSWRGNWWVKGVGLAWESGFCGRGWG